MKSELVIASECVITSECVIADLIRNPCFVWHWIPDQVRDDSLQVRDDSLQVRDDSLQVRHDKHGAWPACSFGARFPFQPFSSSIHF